MQEKDAFAFAALSYRRPRLPKTAPARPSAGGTPAAMSALRFHGLTPPTSAPEPGSPLPHLHRDRAYPCPHLHRDSAGGRALPGRLPARNPSTRKLRETSDCGTFRPPVLQVCAERRRRRRADGAAVGARRRAGTRGSVAASPRRKFPKLPWGNFRPPMPRSQAAARARQEGLGVVAAQWRQKFKRSPTVRKQNIVCWRHSTAEEVRPAAVQPHGRDLCAAARSPPSPAEQQPAAGLFSLGRPLQCPLYGSVCALSWPKGRSNARGQPGGRAP